MPPFFPLGVALVAALGAAAMRGRGRAVLWNRKDPVSAVARMRHSGQERGRKRGGKAAMQWWEGALGILSGLAGVYVILLAGLWVYARRNPEVVGMKDALRLLPDLLRVIRRMAADRTVSPGVRIRLFLLLAYLVMPVDLVPDFLPVIGYADDVVIVAWVLRCVIRSAGPEAFRRHWPGTPAGLQVIERLAGLSPRAPEQEKP